MSKLTRREALARMGALMAMGGLGFNAGIAAPASDKLSAVSPGSNNSILPSKAGDGSMVLAHITDQHITDKYHSQAWVAKCLHDIQSHAAKPELILNTGDLVLDSAKTDRTRTDEYWKIFKSTFKNENSLPMHEVLGNHDVWGTRMVASSAPVNDPMFGKELAQEKLGLDKLYYSFDKGNWHFVMLDAITPVASSPRFDWIGKLGDAQMQWLKKDLAASKGRPTVVCSHVPIIQVSSMLSLQPGDKGAYEFGPKNMMSDARQIIDIFKKHSNVKLCFSGHTHRRDRVTLDETTYINGGSVCGAQWHVMEQPGTRPGYSIAKLHSDGTFDYEYQNYGWKRT